MNDIKANDSRLSDEVIRLLDGSAFDAKKKAEIIEFRNSRSVSERQWRDICLVLYRRKLLDCLEDHRLTAEEERYLNDLALVFELPDEEANQVRVQLADTAMKRFVRQVLEDQDLTDGEKMDFFRLGRFLGFPDEQIRDYLTGESLRYYTEFWDLSSSKTILDSSKLGQLREFQRNLGIRFEPDEPTERDYAKLKLLWMIKNGLMPKTPEGIFPEYDEVCHWLQKSKLYEETNYQDFSRCVSNQGIPVAGGTVYIIESSKGHLFDHSRLPSKRKGEFAVTNHRVLFRSQSKTIDLPFKALVDVRVYQHGIQIQREGNALRVFFELEDVDLAASVLSGALQRMHG